jgi:hypothetical protein
MNRSRALCAAALSTVLFVTAAPALEARPLAKPQVAVSAIGGEWLSSAWGWLVQVFQVEPRSTASKVTPKAGSGTNPPPPPPIYQMGGGPMTGSCIDPNGCTFGGGGT